MLLKTFKNNEYD